MTLTGATTPALTGTGNNFNKMTLYAIQNSCASQPNMF